MFKQLEGAVVNHKEDYKRSIKEKSFSIGNKLYINNENSLEINRNATLIERYKRLLIDIEDVTPETFEEYYVKNFVKCKWDQIEYDKSMLNLDIIENFLCREIGAFKCVEVMEFIRKNKV